MGADAVTSHRRHAPVADLGHDRDMPLARVLVVVVIAACGGGTSPPAMGPEGGSAPIEDAAEAAHHELLRIEQEFHRNDDYRIVVDAWVATEPSPRIVRVTMGWLDIGAGDVRSPFGKGVRRHVDVLHERRSATTWVIALVAADVRRELEIILGDDGVPRVFAQVVGEAGLVRCQPHGGRLISRRVLGLPIALGGLELECVDDNGATLRGNVATRAVE